MWWATLTHPSMTVTNRYLTASSRSGWSMRTLSAVNVPSPLHVGADRCEQSRNPVPHRPRETTSSHSRCRRRSAGRSSSQVRRVSACQRTRAGDRRRTACGRRARCDRPATTAPCPARPDRSGPAGRRPMRPAVGDPTMRPHRRRSPAVPLRLLHGCRARRRCGRPRHVADESLRTRRGWAVGSWLTSSFCRAKPLEDGIERVCVGRRPVAARRATIDLRGGEQEAVWKTGIGERGRDLLHLSHPAPALVRG